jgi:hypothetical protein
MRVLGFIGSDKTDTRNRFYSPCSHGYITPLFKTKIMNKGGSLTNRCFVVALSYSAASPY